MADNSLDAQAVREVRDRLRADLAELDRLGQRMAAIELDSAIQILNRELGEQPDEAEIQSLQRRFFTD